MIPLFVDCSGRRVVIFGGGEVACRKARFFVPEANVTVVSRSFIGKFAGLMVNKQETDVGVASDDALRGILSGAFLVVGALSDPVLNNRIGRLCKDAGILFNNADGEAGDVIVPSLSRGSNYCIAISTGGSSPAVSRFIREHLETTFPTLDAMIELQAELREALKKAEPSQSRRNEILNEVLSDPSVWQALGKDPALARKQVFGRYLHG